MGTFEGDALYPPVDPGLQILDPVVILASNAKLMNRLKLHAAVQPEVFELRFAGPLQRLASFVNVLPGSASGLFAGQAGLFRAALEMAFYSFQASDGRIFTGREGVERRHALEGRWRYLCFLTGLLYPLGRTLERIVVTSECGVVWKRHFDGISVWAREQDAARVFVSWASTREDDDLMGPSGSVSALVPIIAGRENLQMLEDGMADLVAVLFDLSSGVTRSNTGVAQQVLSNCWDRVCRREVARRPQAFRRLTVGTHQGPYLIGAIRALVERGAWKINESCLRAYRGGLYLCWPDAAKDLIAFGRESAIPGWPHNAPTLAQLLRAAGIVLKGKSPDGLIEVVDDAGEIHHALQFSNPLSVVEDFIPEAFSDRSPERQSVRDTGSTENADNAALNEPVPRTDSKEHGGRAAQSKARPSEPSTVERDEDDFDRPNEEIVRPAPDPPLAKAHAVGSAPTAHSAAERAPLKEAKDVRYSDLVPEEIAHQIGNALQVELLGKIVKAWRDRGSDSTVMRRIDEGAAFAMPFLAQNIRDAVTWVDFMAKAGIVYAPPDKRGMRVQRVSITEGRAPVNAVVLNNFACKRLGL